MTIQELAKVIGALPAGDTTVHHALCAWLEPPDYPTHLEAARAATGADEILENIAKTVRLYAPAVPSDQ